MIPQRRLNHRLDAEVDEQDTQAAQIARYSMSLHEYTQQLWQEARRRAELNAASRAGGRKHRQPQNNLPNFKK